MPLFSATPQLTSISLWPFVKDSTQPYVLMLLRKRDIQQFPFELPMLLTLLLHPLNHMLRAIPTTKVQCLWTSQLAIVTSHKKSMIDADGKISAYVVEVRVIWLRTVQTSVVALLQL